MKYINLFYKKALIILFIFLFSITTLMSGCNKISDGKETITSDEKVTVNYENYYPYNTFMDFDHEYIYFAVSKSGNKPDSDKGGIYRTPRAGGKTELIYKNDADAVTMTDGNNQTINYNPPILSIAYWNGYIYFLRLNSIYRVSVESGECMQLVEKNNLMHYTKKTVNLLRIFNDILYVGVHDLNKTYTYVAFDLNESDTLEVGRNTEKGEYHDMLPVSKYVEYDDNEYVFQNQSKIHKEHTFFDYQANCVGYLIKDYLELYDFRGNHVTGVSLEPNSPFSNPNSDGNENWTNLSNKKAYKFFRLKHYSDEGELLSQDEFYSLVIYNLAQQSYKIIELSDDFFNSGVAIDIIDDKAYWQTCSGNIACYDTVSDELYLIV